MQRSGAESQATCTGVSEGDEEQTETQADAQMGAAAS